MQRETNKNMNKEKPVQNRKEKENIQKKQGKTEVCPYAKKCGGCDYQGMNYEKQLKEKQD